MARRRKTATIRRQPAQGFTPFRAPTSPPPGYYDPSIDAQERAAERGYGDLRQDLERAQGYAYTDTFDPRIGSIAGLTRQRDDTLFDLTRSRDRGVEDIGTSRVRGEEDYGRSVEELQRGYQRLGNTQRQQTAAAGVRGGAGIQALAKRTANEAFDRVPMDRGIMRLRSDLTRDETRLGEDYGTQTGRVNRDYGIGVERETTNYGRGVDERGVTGYRAGRELGEYKLDATQQRFFQSNQAGYEAPAPPENERNRYGLTFQVGNQNKPAGQRTYTLPSGQTFNRQQWVGYIRRRRKNGGGSQTLYG